ADHLVPTPHGYPRNRLVGDVVDATVHDGQLPRRDQFPGDVGAFINNIIISVPSTLLPLTICSLAAFAFSWINFPFRDTLFLIIVALLMIPAQVAFIPVLQLMKPFGFTNNFIGIWLAHTAFALPFGIFL